MRLVKNVRSALRTLYGMPPLQDDLPHLACAIPHGPHVLFVAQKVPRDKAVRHRDDIFVRPEIVLHEEDSRAGMVLLKCEQRIRVGRTEPVDALVLVTDHEEVCIFPCQKCDDRVLDL